MTKRVSLPLSALLLALVAALALGTVGSATAAGLTKSTVKKLAAKVVDKKASGLSVAHAKTADSATTAGNATQLGGASASTYLDRIATENLTTTTPVATLTDQQITNPTGVTVPAGVGWVHVTGNASFSGGGGGAVDLWPMMDNTCSSAPGAGWDHRSESANIFASTLSVDFTVAVTPGNHSFRLCARSVGAISVTTRSISMETVAAGPTG